MEITTRIQGLDQLSKVCRELPVRVGRSALRQATAAGAAVIRDEARNLAPVYTGPVSEGHPPPGTLKRATSMKRSNKQSNNERQVFQVYVKHGLMKGVKAYGKTDAFYAGWVEYGTVKMTARPFLRPAFDKTKMQAVQKFTEVMSARLLEESKK
jgi:HK97 gp10 family phage protein